MQLTEAQALLGIDQDGKWGPQSYDAVARGIRNAALRPKLLELHLSPNFTLGEMLRSDNQMRDWQERNHPPAAHLKSLVALCENILEKVRAKFGPVRVTSGYRSWTPDSQHGRGEAADYEVTGVPNLTVAIWVRDNLRFDQLIREGFAGGGANDGWIHTSYRADRARKSVLRTASGRAPYLAGLGG